MEVEVAPTVLAAINVAFLLPTRPLWNACNICLYAPRHPSPALLTVCLLQQVQAPLFLDGALVPSKLHVIWEMPVWIPLSKYRKQVIPFPRVCVGKKPPL